MVTVLTLSCCVERISRCMRIGHSQGRSQTFSLDDRAPTQRVGPHAENLRPSSDAFVGNAAQVASPATQGELINEMLVELLSDMLAQLLTQMVEQMAAKLAEQLGRGQPDGQSPTQAPSTGPMRTVPGAGDVFGIPQSGVKALADGHTVNQHGQVMNAGGETIAQILHAPNNAGVVVLDRTGSTSTDIYNRVMKLYPDSQTPTAAQTTAPTAQPQFVVGPSQPSQAVFGPGNQPAAPQTGPTYPPAPSTREAQEAALAVTDAERAADPEGAAAYEKFRATSAWATEADRTAGHRFMRDKQTRLGIMFGPVGTPL